MAQDGKTLDLIAVGRSSVDLYGQQVGGRLEDMASFSKYLGGSPTNTAAGGARLGLKTGLLTRVGADHMGRFIREQLQREGVDVAGVLSDPDRLTALVILGIRDRVNFPLIFYRENCADMALQASDVDEAWFTSAEAVLINGTHLSQPNVYETSLKAARAVKASGGRVAFDIDYRPVLWGLTGKDAGENRFVENPQVTAKLQEVVALCDLIVGTEEEIHILGGSTDTIAALRAIRRGTDALLVCKRGPEGCVAFPDAIPDSLDKGVSARGFKVEVFNVLGAGDAFMAGFLRGWLRHESVETCCEWGNACGAIVVSRHGCAPAMPNWHELEIFFAGRDWPHRLRDSAYLEHVHWAGNRQVEYPELTVLAIDHRSQLEVLAAEQGAAAERLGRFKELALEAVDTVGQGAPGVGILLDGRFGIRALERSEDCPFWTGRAIELPGSRPLRFEGGADPAIILRDWPMGQVVKCLCFYHPDDPPALREEQDRAIVQLFEACRATRHELLLEIIASKHGAVDGRTVARVIEHIYDLGVMPDWWKLEPSQDPTAWSLIEATVSLRDPLCRGIVLLGLAAPVEELAAGFAAAASSRLVKGFAVGRTIFQDVAAQWLHGTLDDAAARTALADRFGMLVDAWRSARTAHARAA